MEKSTVSEYEKNRHSNKDLAKIFILLFIAYLVIKWIIKIKIEYTE
jgi:hypothetical protein